MLSPALYCTLTLVLMWNLQSVMSYRELPIFVFSVIVGINAFMRMFYSSVSGKLLEKIKLSGIIKLQSTLIVMATIAACLSLYAPTWMVYVCLLIMVGGSASNVLANMSTSVLVNHRIQSDERATILSVKSMIARAFQGVGLMCLKPLFDGVGIAPTFMISALLLVPILICAYHLYKMKLETLNQ